MKAPIQPKGIGNLLFALAFRTTTQCETPYDVVSTIRCSAALTEKVSASHPQLQCMRGLHVRGIQ